MCPLPNDAAARAPTPPEYSPEERRLLIQLAHRAIDSALKHTDLDMTPPTPHLAQLRGAFTTLRLQGHLRGCVGYVIAAYPLYRTVAETAVAAAFYDNRFAPVTLAEVPDLKVEISVLSPLAPIRAEDIVIGRHGLVVSAEGFRGLLLPQVPVQHGWDRLTFLEQTCYKAGLPPNAWQRGASLEAFTAEVFGE
ncbi:MAG: AmmeMemoRadiSam system protein A [Terriglobales bacterium]